MNSKLEKYTEERDKITAKIAVLEERRKVLDGKIIESETLEIRALMKTEKMTLTDLMALVRSMQEQHRTPYPQNQQTDTNENEEDTEDEEI